MNNNEAQIIETKTENQFRRNERAYILANDLRTYLQKKKKNGISSERLFKALICAFGEIRDYADSLCRIQTRVSIITTTHEVTQYSDQSMCGEEPILLKDVIGENEYTVLQKFNGCTCELQHDYYSALMIVIAGSIPNVKSIKLEIKSCSTEEAQGAYGYLSEYPEHTFEVFTYNAPNR